MHSQHHFIRPNLRLKPLDQFSTLLLIKLAQLIDQEIENSNQLYHAIEQSIIRQTKTTLFASQLQKIKLKLIKKKKKPQKFITKKEKNTHKKQSNHECPQNQPQDKNYIIKSLNKMYKKKFKRSYEDIFYNVWICLLLKAFQKSVKDLQEEDKKYVKLKDRKMLGKKKLASQNRVQRISFIIKCLFKDGLISLKYKITRKKIVRFIKSYELLQKGVKPKQKANKVLKNIMFEILIPQSELINEQPNECNYVQDVTGDTDTVILLYEYIEQELLRRVVPGIPERVHLQQVESTTNLLSRPDESTKDDQYSNIFTERNSISLRPLTKKSIKNIKIANSDQIKKHEDQSSSINPYSISIDPPASAPAFNQQIDSYKDYYKQFCQKQASAISERHHIKNIYIQSSIDDDQGRQSAYIQSLKWKIKSSKHNPKTHLPYFHVISYFDKDDLHQDETEEKVLFVKSVKKKQHDQVEEIRDISQYHPVTKSQFVQRSLGKSLKLSELPKLLHTQQNQQYNFHGKSSNKDINISQAFEENSMIIQHEKSLILRNLKQRYYSNSEPVFRTNSQIIKSEKEQTQSVDGTGHNQNFINQRTRKTKVNTLLDLESQIFSNQNKSQLKKNGLDLIDNMNTLQKFGNKLFISNLKEKLKIKPIIQHNQQKTQESAHVAQIILQKKELYPRASKTFLPLLYQYNPNLPIFNKLLYAPVDQIQNSLAIEDLSPIRNLKKQNESILDLPSDMNNLQSFSWLQIQKEQRKIQQAFQKLKSQQNILDQISYQNHDTRKTNQQFDIFVENYFMARDWNPEMKKNLAKAYLQNQSILSVKKSMKRRICSELLRIWLEQQSNNFILERQKEIYLQKFITKLNSLNENTIKSQWILHKLYDLVNEIFHQLQANVLQSRAYNNPNNIRLYMTYKIIKKLVPIPAGYDLQYERQNSLLEAQIRKLNMNELPQTETWRLKRPSFPILLKKNAIEMNLYLLKYFVEGKLNEGGYVQKMSYILEKMQISEKIQ